MTLTYPTTASDHGGDAACRGDAPPVAVPFTTFGQKAAGEGAAIPSPAAIASAVEDALQHYGVKVCDLPITPEAVWRLINHNPEKERRTF